MLGGEQATKDFEEGTLAHSIGSEQAVYAAGGECAGYVVKNHLPGVGK
jgi:hypothetical protein